MRRLSILVLLLVALLPKAISAGDRASCVPASEVFWLAKNIYHEARGEGELGMIAVGIVTVNRSRNSNYPSTIKGVVTQRNQFSWYGKVDKVNDRQAWLKSLTIAQQILNGEQRGLQLKNVYYFHTRHVKPAWREKLVKVAEIGNHIFYRST